MASDERAVRAANEGFYAAFARRDLAAMDALWVRNGPICCIHPGWAALEERAPIMASWASIFDEDEDPDIRCERLVVRVHADAALVICEEILGDTRLAATNGFVREDDTWRMWHHHAGPIARRMVRRRPLLN